MDFFCNCHFFNQLSDQYAENSKNTLFLDAYLYYNKESIRGRRASGGGNSARNVPGNSPSACRNGKTFPETVPLGTPYAIATTDSEKYIQSLAKKLDEDITKLLDENENLSVTKAAVFCAMDYLDEYRKSTGSAENMRSQIQDYIADAARAKLAEDKAKAENEVLRREAAALREQLAKERRRESRREERAEQAAANEKQG